MPKASDLYRNLTRRGRKVTPLPLAAPMSWFTLLLGFAGLGLLIHFVIRHGRRPPS